MISISVNGYKKELTPIGRDASWKAHEAELHKHWFATGSQYSVEQVAGTGTGTLSLNQIKAI